MNTSVRSEVARFDERMKQMRAAKGLSDFKFYPGAVSEASPEEFAREANSLLDAIEQGHFEEFVFGDSNKKQA